MKFFRIFLPLCFIFSCTHPLTLENSLHPQSEEKNDDTFEKDKSCKKIENPKKFEKKENDELSNAVWLNSQMIFEVEYLMSRLQQCFLERKKYIQPGDFTSINQTPMETTETSKEDSLEKKLELEKSRHEKLIVIKQEVKSQLLRCEYLPL